MKKNRIFKTKNDVLFYIAIALLPTVQFLIFYVGVNANSIRLAFTDYLDGVYNFVWFDKFKEVFAGVDTPYLLKYGLNSIVAYVFSLAVGLPISLIFSYYIFKNYTLSGFFKVIIYVPHILSMMTVALMFQNFAGAAYPKIVEVIFGLKVRSFMMDSPFWSVMVFNIWACRGTGVLMYVGAFSSIPDSVLESAELDGAGDFRQFINIVLPLAFPTISTFLIIGVAGIFVDQNNQFCFYKLPNLMPEHRTMGYFIYATVQNEGISNPQVYPFMSALGIALTFITCAVTFTVKWLLDKADPTN